MSNSRVIATDSAGARTTAKVDKQGNATLRLLPGHYVLTSSERDVCYPKKVDVEAEASRTVVLPCAVG